MQITRQMEKEHSKYMQRCIDLAYNGLGLTSPNPMVGCVIVHDHHIIGEGYHFEFGGPHAEVNAIASVENKELLKDSTLYVNLEPCSHYGKTPPCVDLIISSKIKQVVISNIDPHEKVAGKGIEKLKQAGIQVEIGILEEAGNELNKRFFTFHKQQRPYVILKWAQTHDKFIDVLRSNISKPQPTWITDESTRILVHKWRTEEQAILVGTHTALKDNPRLNVRDWFGKNPIRMVIDKKLSLPDHLHLFDNSIQTVVFTHASRENKKNIHYVTLKGNNFIPGIMDYCYQNQIISIIVEGGSSLLQWFIEQNMWDEARVFTGKLIFENGVDAPEIKESAKEEGSFNNTLLSIYMHQQHV